LSDFITEETNYGGRMAEYRRGQSHTIQQNIERWASGKLSQNSTAGFFSKRIGVVSSLESVDKAILAFLFHNILP